MNYALNVRRGCSLLSRLPSIQRAARLFSTDDSDLSFTPIDTDDSDLTFAAHLLDDTPIDIPTRPEDYKLVFNFDSLPGAEEFSVDPEINLKEEESSPSVQATKRAKEEEPTPEYEEPDIAKEEEPTPEYEEPDIKSEEEVEALTKEIHALRQRLHDLCMQDNEREADSVFLILADKRNANTQCYNDMIAMYCRSLTIEPAMRIYDRMLRARRKPDAHTYDALIIANAKLRCANVAANHFGALQARGLKPLQSTYEAMLEVYSRESRYDLVKDIIDEMQEHGYPVSIEIYNYQFRGILAKRDLRLGIKLFTYLKAQQIMPNYDTYLFLVKLFALYRKEDGVNRMIREMKFKGFTVDEDVYHPLLSLLARLKRKEKAVRILKLMVDSGCNVPDASYAAIMAMYVRLKEFDTAEKFFFSIKQKFEVPNADIWSDMVLVSYKTFQYDLMLKYFLEMSSASVHPTLSGFYALLDYYSNLPDVHKMDAVMRTMMRIGVEPDLNTYNLMIKNFSEAGDKEKCEWLFDLMRDEGLDPNIFTLTKMSEVYQRTGFRYQYEQMQDRILRMKKDLKVPRAKKVEKAKRAALLAQGLPVPKPKKKKKETFFKKRKKHKQGPGALVYVNEQPPDALLKELPESEQELWKGRRRGLSLPPEEEGAELGDGGDGDYAIGIGR